MTTAHEDGDMAQGAAFLQAGRFAEAVAAFSRAITTDPSPQAYNNRGTAYIETNNYEAAVADFDCAITLQPDYALAYNNRGFAHRQLEDTAAALADYEQAITLQPDYAQAYFNRALTVLEVGGSDAAAVADFAEFLRLDRQLGEQLAEQIADTIFARAYALACLQMAEAAPCDDAREWLRMAALVYPGYVPRYLTASTAFDGCKDDGWREFVSHLR